MIVREIERQGEWLFRRRSYVPLVLLPFIVLELAIHREPLWGSPQAEGVYETVCLIVSLAGLMVRAVAQGQAQAGSSGRNTRQQIADHLNTRGIYSAVRHPLYLGNITMIIGILLFTQSPTLVLAGLGFYLLFYERIMAAEERFLSDKFGEPYREWAARTPALIPRFSRWESSAFPFSWRAAVKGEFYGFTATVVVMAVMNALKLLFAEGRLTMQPFWMALSAAAVLLFVILRFVRKHTRFLERDSRLE
jgi:protein-S-isoprenylcysteine O-methyltransferase Ste14